MSSSSRDALMAQLVDMGYSQVHAAAYSLRYPSLESALEHLLAAESAGQLEADAQPPQQPPQYTPIEPLPEEHKQPDTHSHQSISAPLSWQPLRRSSLTTPGTAECDSDVPQGDDEVDELHLLTSCHATSSVHTHLLQQWTHTTLMGKLSGSRRSSIADERSIATTLGSPSLSSVDALVTPSCDISAAVSPALQPLPQLLSSTTATLSTLVLAAPAGTLDSSTHSLQHKHSTGTEDEAEEDECCDVCFDAPKECLFLPCQHVSLCSGCTESYFSRTRAYNVCAAGVRAEAEAEAARAPRFAAGANSVLSKNADRSVSCPCCSQTVQIAIRKSSSAAVSRRASNASELTAQ